MSIQVRNISKSFGSFHALEKVSLTIPDGELVALLGPSGSGKTTLLRIIAGLEEPDNADGDAAVLFSGQDVLHRPAGQRQVGFVFQHYALFRHMSVLENIAFGLRVRPRKTRPPEAEIRRRAAELLGLVQLEGLGHRLPSELSGGQRQRVALARALAVEPGVLLLDEPFGALDARVRRDLRSWLRRLHDDLKVTSVFVTHDQEEALEVADRIVVMNKGKIEQIGTPEEIFHHPASEFVMRFIGQVNLFHGRVEGGRGQFGPLVVDAQAQVAPSSRASAAGHNARLLVRPHQWLVSVRDDIPLSIPAQVARVQSAGPAVRLELRDGQGETIHAEISHERAAELRLAPQSRVYLTPRETRVFVDEYAI